MKFKNTKLSKILTKNFLINEYITKNKTCKQIGIKVKCSYGTILYNLKKHKIKIKTLRDISINRYFSKQTKSKLSKNKKDFYSDINNHPWFGKKRPEHSIKITGIGNGRWLGGKSFEPYPLGWNKTLKDKIRDRDNYKCQLCGCSETECVEKLHCHHIDYDKLNIKEDNLISLCRSCHTKTNNNRNYWKGVLLKIYEKYKDKIHQETRN